MRGGRRIDAGCRPAGSILGDGTVSKTFTRGMGIGGALPEIAYLLGFTALCLLPAYAIRKRQE